MEIGDSAQQTVFFNNDVVSPSAQYEYDAVYRLIEATGREHAGGLSDAPRDQNDLPIQSLPHPNDTQALRNYTEQYVYDAVGNLLRMVHQAGTGSWTRWYAYEAATNRLTSTTGDPEHGPFSTYAHDAHGNMTSMPHITALTWDENDQVRSTDLGGGGDVYYDYDAAGQRVRKVWEHSGLVEERIYLGGYEVYRRRNSSGLELERQTLHVMDGARRVAMVETKTVDTSGPFTVTPRVRYQLGNHLGSASLEVDAAGLVIGYEEYHPYGTTAYWSAASGIEVSQRRYRYTGKEKDEETGLYYHGARYYAPWLGRWTSADPAGLVDGPNLYVYVVGNPLKSIDSTGLESEPHEIRVRARPPGLSSRVERWAYSEDGSRLVTSSAEDFAEKTRGLQVFVYDKDADESNTALERKAAELHKARSMAAGLIDAWNQAGSNAGRPGKHADVEANGGAGQSAQGESAGNQLTQDMALAAGIVNEMLDEDIKPREGASPHGIVGGRREGAESTPLLQAAASGVMLGASLLSQAMMKAIRAARRLASSVKMLPPKGTLLDGGGVGLKGKDFEKFLTERLGGSGSFSRGGRDFDGGVGNRWWEAKSGDYWKMLENEPHKLQKFRSDMAARLRIAQDGSPSASYEIFSNSPIPEHIKSWLTKKGIPYTEVLK
ncbi:RHS repeat domain-containing protein [Sorangium cellulosum]|uniref:Uncharacterized protein n=1 Tax=Sorangium cellulosum So0157-2 TaxID=1254432 RepID=S4Y3R1_SORCE|nr:RHS repeat-associated core domain-containing protein [Sorangium cellulosum]AGP39429.1 hypothetical protein SCE1572_36070 [Sorangium cellulosum So0157-2]